MLISDVTSLEAKRESTRQSARLQLIGEIARGMAHDVNTLLCTIAGYTSLLKKHDTGSADFNESLQQISRGVEKGTALAGRLIELTRPIGESGRTPMSLDNIRTGLDRLRESQQSDLKISAELEEIPPVALTALRIEQIVFNLGLLLINPEDPAPQLYIRTSPPSGDHAVLSPGDDSGGILLMASSALSPERLDELKLAEERDEGVIVSVLSTMIRQSSGRLDIFSDSHGERVYRICLAPATGVSMRSQEHSYVTELGPYFQNWAVLLAAYGAVLKDAESRMKSLNMRVHRAASLASLLSTIENGTSLDAIIIQEALISEETGGIIKAILKLTPGAAVVVLQSATDTGNVQKLEQDVVILEEDTSLDQILLALIEAKALAVRRSQGSART